MCPIHAAAQAGRLPCLEFLLAHCPLRISSISDDDGATPVHFAAAKGRIDCLRLLLKQKDCNVDQADKFGSTPAHDAAAQGQLESLRVLAAHGAQFNRSDVDGATPLDLARAAGRAQCTEFLRRAVSFAQNKTSAMAGSPASSADSSSPRRSSIEEADLVADLACLPDHVGNLANSGGQLADLFRKPSAAQNHQTEYPTSAVQSEQEAGPPATVELTRRRSWLAGGIFGRK